MSIGSYGHPDQRFAGCSRSIRNAIPFCPHIRNAHILPPGARMAVHEDQSLAAFDGRTGSPCEIARLEARVTVEIPFALGRRQNGRDDGRLTLHACTGRPQAKAEIFLAFPTSVVLQEVGAPGQDH